MNKHTPGPWGYENDEDSLERWNVFSSNTDNHDVVAVIPKTGDEDYDNEVTFANVRLIAAAPELLEALRRLKAFAEMYTDAKHADYSKVCLQAADAIAKAKGTS